MSAQYEVVISRATPAGDDPIVKVYDESRIPFISFRDVLSFWRDDVRYAPLGVVRSFTSLSYTRVTNEVADLTLVCPASAVDPAWLDPFGVLTVYRKIGQATPYADTDTSWLITRVRYFPTTDSYEITAANWLYLLASRIINSPAGTDPSAKTGSVAATIYNILRDQFRDVIVILSGAGRNFRLGIISTEFARGSIVKRQYPWQYVGDSDTRSFAWRNILDVIREMIDANPVPMFIDIDAAGTLYLYTVQRGTDRRVAGAETNPQPGNVLNQPEAETIPPSLSGPQLSPNVTQPTLFTQNTLADVVVETDASQYISEVVVGGQGQETDRLMVIARRRGAYVQTGSNTPTLTYAPDQRPPLDKWQQFVQATQFSTTAPLVSAAFTELRKRDVRTKVEGRILDTGVSRYGIDWGFGDYITVEVGGARYDVRISAVSVSVSGEGEQITARFKG